MCKMAWSPVLFRSTLACAAAALGMAVASAASAPAPHLVVGNGKVFTADGSSSLAEACAVKDGRFVAVGTSAAMRAQIGPATKVIDLAERFVTPGLADGHFHGVAGGPGIGLADVRSLDALFA